jgi:hypothetical protein
MKLANPVPLNSFYSSYTEKTIKSFWFYSG